MNRIISYFLNPKSLVLLLMRKTAKLWSDKLYLEIVYYIKFGKRLNLNNPKSLNEKLNWLKLYDRNPLYVRLADKYEVKDYVRKKIGDKYVVPCLGIWNHFDDIDFDLLPNQFILKATHDSGGAFICKNKDSFDKDKAREKMEYALNNNFFYVSREWPYKNIPHRIIADKFLNDDREGELQDYKFWCFNGAPTVFYMTNKGENIYENFYDMDFNPLDMSHGFPRSVPEYKKPLQFDEMKDLAAKLSQGIPFVRVDFFIVEGNVYFGEFTFYDWAGLRPFKDISTDLKLGEYLMLRNCSVNPVIAV